MGTTAFQELLPLVVDGQPVQAGTIDPILQILDGNVHYLRDLINSLGLGGPVFARGVTIESAAQVGMAVWYNPATQQFERALAAATNDPVTGFLTMAPSAFVWGVVYDKPSATSADLMLGGFAPLSLAAAVTGTVVAGAYYLSGSQPGMLVSQKPAASVPVLLADGNGNVIVQPQMRDMLESHRHYKFPLRCLPAGGVIPPSPGNPHTINTPDNTKEGWLPASDPIFKGTAPSVAVFGYNWSKASFAKLWPPIPLSGVYIDFDRGNDPTQGFHGAPLGTQGLVYCDRNGIWWTSDCYGDVPWPTTLTTAEEASLLSQDSDIAECPRDLRMAMNLYFTAPTFQNTGTVVTSLVAGAGGLLSVKCQGTGAPAATGPLEIDLNLAFTSGPNNVPGYNVLKSVSGTVFSSGPVLEGVRSSTSNLTITGTASRAADPADPNQTAFAQGLCTLSVSTAVGGTELPIELVRLSAAMEQFYQSLMELGFPVGKASQLRGKFYVPVGGVPANSNIALRMRLLGRAAGTLPVLTFGYRRIPRPVPAATPLALPLVDTTLAMPAGLAVGVDQYVEVLGPVFQVQPGDVVQFSLGRNASDGYTGDVLLLHQAAVFQ